MKTLKIVLLVLVIGFTCSVPEKKNFSTNYYPTNSYKGVLLAVNIFKPAQFAVLAVEGGYEYYLQYVKFKLDYQKDGEDRDPEKERISSSCTWLPWI